MKKSIAFLLVLFLFTAFSTAAGSPEISDYDREAAVAKAEENQNEPKENCSQYASRCLRAGGVRVYGPGATQLAQALRYRNDVLIFHRNLQTQEELKIDHKLSKILRPGDIGIYWCWNCNKTIGAPYLHVFFYMGTDENGYVRAYSHNPWETPDAPYRYMITCYDCPAVLNDIFYFHFLQSLWVSKDGIVTREDMGGWTNRYFSYAGGKAVLTDGEGRVMAVRREAEQQIPENMLISMTN